MSSKHRIFVSYVRGDATSERVVADLARKLPVWTDVRSVKPGESVSEAIDDALETADAFVFLVTPLASRSPSLAYEVGFAMARSAEAPEVQVVPVLLDGAKRSDLLAALPAFRWIDGDSLALDEIVESVQREVAADPAPA